MIRSTTSSVLSFVGRELRQRGAGGDGVGPTVRHGVQRAHPLGDGVAGLACEVDKLVELQVEVAEVGADDVPVRLLALQVQFDQIDQHPLQVVAQLRRWPENPCASCFGSYVLCTHGQLNVAETHFWNHSN